MTAPRPILLPGLPRAWRDPHTLQLGLDPARAVLLDLRDPSTAGLLDLLDGTRTETALLAQARDRGIRPDQARALLVTLQTAGLVVPCQRLHPEPMPPRLAGEAGALAYGTPAPAQTLRRRAGARVVVAGRGRLAPGIAVALAEAGVGHLRPDLPGPVLPADLPGGPLSATDLGQPRAAATATAVGRAAPGTKTHAVRRGAASLVIQLDYDQPVALLAAAHARRRQPYLTVTIREATPVVGPLVPPGTAPCLNCLALHRADRDLRVGPGQPFPPDHPSLAARSSVPAEPCAVATLLAATAYVVGEALAFLDGGSPQTVGGEVEIGAPGRVRRRSWPAHPECGCVPRRRRTNGT